MRTNNPLALAAALIASSMVARAQAQENASPDASNSTEFRDYHDNFWGHAPDPDMSPNAIKLTTPDFYYLEENGFIVMECESVSHNENWTRMTEPEGYFGDGYLKYVGKNLQGNNDGHNTDVRVKYQQNIEDRLIFPIRIQNPGTYRARVQVIHHEEDGDNDAWINLVRTPRRASRLGGKDPGKFHWNKFGWDGTQIFDGKFNTFTFEVPGDYLLYIGGRSTGFGVDRIVLHKDDQQERALDTDTPVSKKVSVR